MFIWKETKKRCNPFAIYVAPDGKTHVRVPSHLFESYPEPQPPREVNDNPDHFYRTELEDAPYVVWTKKSQEHINQITLEKLKNLRTEAVANIKVQTQSGKVFDGDERSQDRMARAITAMGTYDTVNWVLSNNSVIEVTKEELVEALRLAGNKMSEEWVKPYKV